MPAEEYRVKAALIYKLTRFVQWPDTAFAGANAPLGICVLGDDPFGSALDALTSRTSGGRPIAVFRLASLEEAIGRCQVLFLADSERVRLSILLTQLARQPILSVSDIAGFARRGGILQMYTATTRIRFVINHHTALWAGLRIAASLLALAEIVDTADDNIE